MNGVTSQASPRQNEVLSGQEGPGEVPCVSGFVTALLAPRVQARGSGSLSGSLSAPGSATCAPAGSCVAAAPVGFSGNFLHQRSSALNTSWTT